MQANDGSSSSQLEWHQDQVKSKLVTLISMKVYFRAEQRRLVLKDWNAEFPEFQPKGSCLVRLVGPLLQGISFQGETSDWTYLPTAYVQDLSQPELPLRSLVEQRLTVEGNGTTDYISVRWHSENYATRAAWLARSSVIPLSGSLTVRQVVRGFTEWSRTPKSCISYPMRQYLSGVRLFVWCGNAAAAQEYLEQRLSEASSWPESVFAHLGGLQAWRDKMVAQLQEAPFLRDRVQQRITTMRMTKISQFELMC